MKITMEITLNTAIVKVTGKASDVGMILTILNNAANASGIDLDYITPKQKSYDKEALKPQS